MTTGVFRYRAEAWRERLAQAPPPQNPLAKVFRTFANQLPRDSLNALSLANLIKNPVESRREQQKIFAALLAIPKAKQMLDEIVAEQEKLFARDLVEVKKPVRNGRLLRNPSFNTNGFVISPHRSAVKDWRDPEEVRRIYYPEISALVKQLSGATIAVCNSHLFRQSGLTGPIAKLFNAGTGPIMDVHNDFTDQYFDAIVRIFQEMETKEETRDFSDFGAVQGLRKCGVTSETLRDSRLVVFNAWRNVGDAPLLRTPLAVVDNRTVSRKELIPGSIGGDATTRGLGVYVSEHNPAHEFYYMPQMTKEEVLLIKGYDSEVNPFIPTLHTAFDDPATPKDAPQRTSIDARVLCIFPKTQRQAAPRL